MSVPAREGLTVFFDGEERPGVIFYALARPGTTNSVVFPIGLWPRGEARPFRLGGESWEVHGWDLALGEWPRGIDWTRAVHDTLKSLVDAGAVVAWVGAEGCPFSDPPDLLSPEWMSGGVLAAITSAGEFICAIDPDLPVQALSDDELASLRRHARGLADATS